MHYIAQNWNLEIDLQVKDNSVGSSLWKLTRLRSNNYIEKNKRERVKRKEKENSKEKKRRKSPQKEEKK